MAGYADLYSPTQTTGMFGQAYGSEFDRNKLLNLVVPSIRAQGQNRTAQIGAFTRTRGLSGGQEADLFGQGFQADAGAMSQAALEADKVAAEAANKERLINQAYQFQKSTAEQEQINKQKDQLANLIGQGVGAVGGIVTGAIGTPSIEDIYKNLIQKYGGGGMGSSAVAGAPDIGALPTNDSWLRSSPYGS
jgi:hypothetical protein